MSDGRFEWTLIKAATLGSNCLEVLRRNVITKTAEVQADMEPFFSVDTLLEYKDSQGYRIVKKGNVQNVSVRREGLELDFDSSDAGCFRLLIGELEGIVLTVWRINNVLDTIQIAVRSAEGYLYLQTGGAGILHLSSGKDLDADSREILDIFNEPLVPLRSV